MNNYIKVNLPLTEKDYKLGTGEGVFILVDDDTKAAYDKNETGGLYSGILNNDSIYYPELKHGDQISFEMRGENRPIVPYGWLMMIKGEGEC